MVKSKKSVTKSESESRPPEEGTVVARPKHEGKDPLAGGDRLHNVSNSSDAKTYESSQNKLAAVRPVASSNGPVLQSPPAHQVPNSPEDEQDEVAKGRTEK